MNGSGYTQLREQADQDRNNFLAGLARVKKRLEPAQLIDEAIRSGDTELKLLRRVNQAIQKNPAWVLAILAAVWLLLEDAKPTKARRSHITTRKLPSPRKETTNGRDETEGHERG